jgi:signal transduction histidine kinase
MAVPGKLRRQNNMNHQKFAKKLVWAGLSGDREAHRHTTGMLYRFRLLFYTGGAISVLLVAILGVISYNSISLQHAGRVKFIVAAGTVLVLAIVGFLVFIVLNELNNRFRAYQREHELNLLKSNFITLASHEFRTPLSSVLLSAGLIEKYAQNRDTEGIFKHSLKIKQVVHRVESMLDDFLSLEKLDAGQITANAAIFDLDKLCRDTLDEVRLLVATGQQLCYEPSAGVSMIRLDEELIHSALSNLLSNAVKYAGEGARIRLVTEVTDQQVIISVKDNGDGIAVKDQEKLFTIFYRVCDSGNIPGRGLGLYIVKRYVQLMSGTIKFYSKPKEETCFEMTFPRLDAV